jgi:phage shock protein PspC (stress-responsive transcriptional regulator)
MTSPTSEGQHSGLDSFFSAVRGIGIRRRTDNKWVGGVCSGIATRLRIDPVVVRAGLILLILFGGVGIAAYLVAWVLLPDSQDRIAAERALRDGDAGSIVLLVVAAIALFSGFPWWLGGHDGAWGFPWGLLVLAAIVWVVVRRSRNGGHAGTPPVSPSAGADPVSPAASPQSGLSAGPSAGPGQATSQTWPDQAATWGGQPDEAAGSWGGQHGEPVATTRRSRRRSGGLLMTLVAVGLAMVAYGGTLWLGDRLGFSGDHHVIALAATLAALGLLVLGLGVAGWRTGFVGVLAILTALATLGSGAVADGARWGGRVGDVTWNPTAASLAAGQSSYRIGVGDGRLDLRGLPVDGLANPTIPVRVGMGDLTVVVPEGLTLALRGHVGLGEITVPEPDRTRARDGSDVQQNVRVGTGPTEVTVDANVGVGQITVVKE